MTELSQIIIKPLITEKSMQGSEIGRYSFAVNPNANKAQIKQAAKEFLGVDVIKVNTSFSKGKTRRYGKTQGRTKTWKKAIITIKPGQKIELFES